VPSGLDVALAVLFAAVIATIDALYSDRRFKRQVAAGVPDARRKWYRRVLITEWVVAVLVVALWAWQGRAWATLGLALPHGWWRLLVNAVAVATIARFVMRQNAAVRRMSAERAVQLAPRLAGLEFMLPHTAGEYRWFIALSCTAGICEELFYRGFLTWVITWYTGLPAAILIAAAAFGLAHAYQGRKGMVKAGVVGLVMSLIVLASGWLIAAMIIHALVDLAGGTVGFAVLGHTRGADSTPTGHPAAEAASTP
jgi:membrane protease YdiL (CAAX protease family)